MAMALGGGTSRMSGAAIAAAIDASSASEEALASALAGNATAMESLGGAAKYLPGGTGAQSRTVQGKLRDYVAITDFPGIDITGASDSSSAIQDALDAIGARRVLFPSGTYLLNSAVVPVAGQKFHGDNATIKQGTRQVPCFDCSTGIDRLEFQDLFFLGIKESPYTNNPSSQAIAIKGDNCEDLTVDNCTFTDFCYAALSVQVGGVNIKFTNNTVHGPGSTVITSASLNATNGAVITGDGILIEGNVVHDTSQGFIVGQGSANIRVAFNRIYDVLAEHGIYADTGLQNILIHGNVVEDTEKIGMKIQWYDAFGVVPENMAVIGNTVRRSGQVGISLLNGNPTSMKGKGATIVGNTILDAGAGGIDIRYLDGFKCSGNTIYNCADVAIYVQNSTNGGVNDNTVFDAGNHGIQLITTNKVNAKNNDLFDIGTVTASSDGIWINGGGICTISGNDVRGSTYMQYGFFWEAGSAADLVCRNNVFVGATDVGARLNGTSTVLYWGDNVLRGGIADDIGVGLPATNQRGNELMYYSTAVPSSGTWAAGSIVLNSAAAAGGKIGWVCTTAGTPGTWKAFGVIDA